MEIWGVRIAGAVLCAERSGVDSGLLTRELGNLRMRRDEGIPVLGVTAIWINLESDDTHQIFSSKHNCVGLNIFHSAHQPIDGQSIDTIFQSPNISVQACCFRSARVQRDS